MESEREVLAETVGLKTAWKNMEMEENELTDIEGQKQKHIGIHECG